MVKGKQPTKKSVKKSAVLSVNLASMRRWQIWLSVIYGLQIIVVLLISTAKSVPVIGNFLGINSLASDSSGHLSLAIGSQRLFDINLVWLVVIPLLVGFVIHLLSATYWRPVYESSLRSGLNHLRWLDVSLSSAAILLILGLLLNIHSAASLVLLIVSGLLVGLLAAIGEASQALNRTLAYTGELIVGVGVWLALAGQLIIWHIYGSGAGADRAWLFFTILGLAIIFLVIQYLSCQKISKWTSHEFADKSYAVSLLIIKSALVWQVYAYFLHP